MIHSQITPTNFYIVGDLAISTVHVYSYIKKLADGFYRLNICIGELYIVCYKKIQYLCLHITIGMVWYEF